MATATRELFQQNNRLFKLLKGCIDQRIENGLAVIVFWAVTEPSMSSWAWSGESCSTRRLLAHFVSQSMRPTLLKAHLEIRSENTGSLSKREGTLCHYWAIAARDSREGFVGVVCRGFSNSGSEKSVVAGEYGGGGV